MHKLFPLLLLTIALTAFDCASKKVVVAPSYAGNWIIAITDTPLGNVQGTLQLDKDETGNYQGRFMANGAEYELRSVTTTEDGVRAAFFFSDYGVDVEMVLSGAPTGPLTGITNEEYMTTAQRE